MNLPAKFVKRVSDNLKKYQTIIQKLKEKEVNESDTVTVIVDILADLFGYDKYNEITSEYAIRGTYCDLAILNNNKIQMLIEAKAINLELNDNYVKQAIDYGVNEGVKWIILTNAEKWKIFKIKFGQPVDKELVFEFNLLNINIKELKDLGMLFAISKDGEEKSAIEDLYSQMQVKNKYIIGSLLNSDDIYAVIKRNMRKLFDDVKITEDEIAIMIKNDIIKREIIDSDDAISAQKAIAKAYKKLDKLKAKNHDECDNKTDQILTNEVVN